MNDARLNVIRGKIMREGFVLIPIFGVPAFSALFIGRYLDKTYQTHKTITLILLAIAFVSSWILVYHRNKKINKEYREYREKQKAEAGEEKI